MNDDLISRQAAIGACLNGFCACVSDCVDEIEKLPSAQKTAKRIIGCSKSGITMWYQCDMCHEPVDEKDTFCRGCGRRFEDE